GDQGIIVGDASDVAAELTAPTLEYAHQILKRMADDRHSGKAPFLEPDSKSQVTLRYVNEVPVEAVALVVSTQHAPGYYKDSDNYALYKELHDYFMSVFQSVLP